MTELLADRYRRVASLGEGAMGEVWLADDLVLGRRVAVKQLRTNAVAQGDPMAVERMMREARTAARLHHPNVVSVHDLTVVDGQPYVIMEYVEGESLGERLRRAGTIPDAEAATLGAQVAGALEAAHRLGIVHRDIKPANIMITDQGTAKLADFGIARARDEVGLTESGMLVGTLAYMAPELVNASEPSPASDIWSLGATLFAAVEGHAPFTASDEDESSGRLVYRLMTEDAPPATRGGGSAPVIARMLARDPAQRPTAGEVARRLASLPVEPTRPTPREEPPTVHVATPAPAISVPPAPTVPPAITVPPALPVPPARSGGRRRSAIVLAVVAVLAVAGVVAYLAASNGSNPTHGRPTDVAGGSTGARTTPTSGGPSTGTPTAPSTGLPPSSPLAGFSDPQQVAAILRDASNDLTSLFTYDYRHLSQHDVQVQDLTTGSFGRQYVELFKQSIDPAVSHDKLSLTSTPVAVGMGPMSGGVATVFLVIDQTRTTGAQLKPALVQRRIVLHVTEVDGRWLVSGMDVKGTISGDPPGTKGLSAALAAARGAVGMLVSLTDGNTDARLPELQALTTGALHDDLRAQIETLTAEARGHGSRGSGHVVATAAMAASGDSATVVLSAYQYVTPSGKSKAVRVHVQLTATMTRVGGVWLVAALTKID